MPKLPLGIRELIRQLQELDKELKKKLNIRVLGQDEKSVAALKEELVKSAPQGDKVVKAMVVNEKKLPRLDPADFFIALLEGDTPPVWIKELVEKRSKVLVIWLTKEESGKISKRLDELAKYLEIAAYKVVASDYHIAESEILLRIARGLRDKEIALAINLPLFRPIVCEEIIHRIARQNALIGVATFIPGSDMPVLTTNQARMVLRLAFCFGERLSIARATELLAVLGGGFTFRAIARQLLSFFPGPGWAIKGGVAYSGTLAVGKAAVRYFETKLGTKVPDE